MTSQGQAPPISSSLVNSYLKLSQTRQSKDTFITHMNEPSAWSRPLWPKKKRRTHLIHRRRRWRGRAATAPHLCHQSGSSETHTIYWSAHHAHPDLCLLWIGWSSGYHGRLAAGRLWVWLWMWLKLDLRPVQVYPTFLPGLLGPAPSALPSRTARFSEILRLLSHISSKLDHLWSIPALYSPVETLLKRLTFKTIIFDLWLFLFLNPSVAACL